ncbi:hypothetical protein [Paenibacillus apiarius]|uniref:hypothetical protein n=1 Tax=Paenibacillus apiarius TaxID=46240 RepID=UPI003B39FC74
MRIKLTKNHSKREGRNVASTFTFLDDIAEFPVLHQMTPEGIRKVVVAAVTEDTDLQGPHGIFIIRI